MWADARKVTRRPWYFITFVDDFTWKVWAYSLRSKDEALTVFSQWLAEVENRIGH